MNTEPQLSNKGRRVIITGAASGFGTAIARRFASTGAFVVLVDRNEAGVSELAMELGDAVPVKADVTVPEQIEAMMNVAVAAYGGVDVLINNAGAGHRPGPMSELANDVFDSQYSLNLRAAFLGVKYALPYLSKGSVVVNVSSMGGRRPRPGSTVYNSSKGGLIALSKALAVELAPKTRVCVVTPTGAQTGFAKVALGVDVIEGPFLDQVIAGIPMGRLAVPDDIASAVDYLCSAEASFLTGTCIDIDGGRSIQ